MKVLFFLRSINYDRHFEAVLRALLARGHRVHVAFDVEKKGRAGDSSLLDRIRTAHPGLSYGLVQPRSDAAWGELSRELRLSTDFLRYLEPEFAGASALRERARQRTSRAITRAAALPCVRGPRGRRLLDRGLRALEASLPLPPELVEFVKYHDPDVVLVSPLVGLGSPQGDYLRVAFERAIPTVLLVASWDNLTNKGVIRDRPDLTIVWNEAQVREAVELHGLPPEGVVAAGAHTYDQWFDWRPSASREKFCGKVGLDPAGPFVLYVCSSRFIAPDEASFVEEWLGRLRESSDPQLRQAGVLIRPHPANAQMWQESDPSEPGLTAVYPREGAAPTDEQPKADYFDSIHHCAAVVGINTSAQVESAIVGRPVFTLLREEFRDSQEGTLHFSHIASEDGLLNVARDWPEHHAQLAEAIASEDAHSERLRRFVRSFARPHGLDVAATPRVVEAIERVAATPAVPSIRSARRVLLANTLGAPLAQAARAAGRLRRVTASRRRPSRRRRHARPERLRILFVLEHPGILMHFDRTVEALAERGHRVQLAFGRPEKFAVALEALDTSSRRIAITERAAPQRTGAYEGVSRRVRAALDYVHYLNPAMAGAEYSRAKWGANRDLPFWMRLLRGLRPLGPRLHDLLRRGLLALEQAIPSDAGIERFIAKANPDVVLVSPLVNQRPYQTDYVKSARALGIAAGLCVASWDNLTSKGLIRTLPDLVTVWNDTQRREAAELHGVPGERIVLTGAQQFDRWFERRPRATREELCRALGLSPGRPYLLFVGSTRQKRDPGAEAAFARDWIAALRQSGDPVLVDTPVLVRPHPTHTDGWEDADFSGLGEVLVWRRESPLPVRGDDRAAYYDTLYHSAAVVGINSSAMVEAAIIGRPVHTVALPDWHDMQRGLLHYHYLLEENGGFIREASSFEEHVRLLARDLRDPEQARALDRSFVEHFIRPHGIDRPATPALVEAIEGLGRMPCSPATSTPLSTRALRAVLLAGSARDRGASLAFRGLTLGGPRLKRELKRGAGVLRRGGRPPERALVPPASRNGDQAERRKAGDEKAAAAPR